MAWRRESDVVAGPVKDSGAARERWISRTEGQGRLGGAVPIAISAEQRALQASIRDWAEPAGTLALVRGLEPGSTARTPGGQAAAVGPPGSPAGAAGSAAGVAHE